MGSVSAGIIFDEVRGCSMISMVFPLFGWDGNPDSVNTVEPLPDAFFNPLYEKLKRYHEQRKIGTPCPPKAQGYARQGLR